jgi:hypothetical protein
MKTTQSVSLKKIMRVNNENTNKCIDRLWDLLWDTLKGEDSYYELGVDSYQFFPKWNFHDGQIQCNGITGKLRGQSFALDLTGFSIRLVLPEAKYSFFISPSAGSGHTEDGHYIKGSDFYSLKAEAKDVKDWMAHPYGTWGTPRALIITPEVEQQVIDFIDDLINTIKDRRTRMDETRFKIAKTTSLTATTSEAGGRSTPTTVNGKQSTIIMAGATTLIKVALPPGYKAIHAEPREYVVLMGSDGLVAVSVGNDESIESIAMHVVLSPVPKGDIP